MSPPPPPPGAPPPPPPVEKSAGGAVEDAAGALFAEIAALGEGVRGNLKKATRGPVNETAPEPTSKPAPKPAQKKAVATGKPVCELAGKKWTIEHQVGNKEVSVDVTMKQTVYIYKCNDSLIKLNGKVNAIVLDSCTKTACVFDEAMVCKSRLGSCTCPPNTEHGLTHSHSFTDS